VMDYSDVRQCLSLSKDGGSWALTSVQSLKFVEKTRLHPVRGEMFIASTNSPTYAALCEGAEVKLSGTVQFRSAPSHGV
jgi:DNA-binding transcriptional regulator GbsR (MarR family)